jgi:hypothetical protein
MKRKVFAVGLLLALSAFTVGRLISPATGEARMTLYQRRPWRIGQGDPLPPHASSLSLLLT